MKIKLTIDKESDNGSIKRVKIFGEKPKRPIFSWKGKKAKTKTLVVKDGTTILNMEGWGQGSSTVIISIERKKEKKEPQKFKLEGGYCRGKISV